MADNGNFIKADPSNVPEFGSETGTGGGEGGESTTGDNKGWVDLVHFNQILPVGVINALNKAVKSLAIALDVLTKILNLLRFFISAFSSFAFILQSFINFVQKQLSKFLGDLVNTGVYFNILVPPSFLKALYDPRASSGGFNGFLGRLRVSLHNSADKNVPDFNDDAVVGGFLIICDSDSLAEIYRGLQFLADMFDFFKLFPINLSPLPPRNVRAVSGYFTSQNDNNIIGVSALGVKLTWDAPGVAGFTHYRISRSTVPYPHNSKTTYPEPSGLMKIIKAATTRLATGKPILPKGEEKKPGANIWPAVVSYVYNDKDFNGGKPMVVAANAITGGGSIIDYDVEKSSTNAIKKYYYVIESGFSSVVSSTAGLWGKRSPEVPVTVNLKGCVSQNEAAVIQHKKGLEYLFSGAPSLGMWSTIRVGYTFPFIETVIEYLNKFLAGLAGALKTNTKSFVDFIKGIQEKVELYVDILSVLIEVILAIEKFFSNIPRISFLNVPPEKGGVDNFVSRVATAEQPKPGFSDANGITVGMVFIYGAFNLRFDSDLTEAEYKVLEKALAVKTALLTKAFNLLISAFS